MSELSRLYLSSCALTALGALVGCAAGAPATPTDYGVGLRPASTVRATSFVDVAAVNAPGGNQVIVGNNEYDTLTIYGGEGRVSAVLTSRDGVMGPAGITTDSSGTLYVANLGARNILAFKKPYNAPPRRFIDLGGHPYDVSFDASTGDIAAVNGNANGPEFVTFYSQKSLKPCATVPSPDFDRIVSLAYNKAGDLYVAGYTLPSEVVGVGIIKGGCAATTTTMLAIPTGEIPRISAMRILTNGNIVLANNGFPSATFTYAPPSHGSFGPPLFTTRMPGTQALSAIAFRAQDQSVWAADGETRSLLVAKRYRWPAGGSATAGISDPKHPQANGIAVNPAQQL